jgi:ribose/xylose/arabinose/galactoside ABC-type transport system permease subunit
MNTSILGNRILDFAFPIFLILVSLGFALVEPSFLGLGNIFGMLHAMAPIAIISTGMALIVMMGKLDISLGSIALVSMGVSAIMLQSGYSLFTAIMITFLVGAILGAVNGFVICFLKVNPLIATLGTMIAFRGLGNQITDAQVVVLPDSLRALGNFSFGAIFFDTVICLLLLTTVHLLHQRTKFGKIITAIGNDEATAQRVGLPVTQTVFFSFVIAGTLASIGGFFASAQVGAVTSFLGKGMEFTAVAVVLVGGISLFGGKGSILWGVILGSLTFEVIRSGLNYLGANPYFYQLIGGVVIFIAMYAAAIKTGYSANNS